jgi:glycosyltransferase involved in cell wall biosynthesis
VLAGLDILVVPSLWYENTPLVIYSAQAAACPVVASDLAGMSEVIRHDIDGSLFPPGDSDNLASIIVRLCTERSVVAKWSENAPRARSIEEYVDDVVEGYRGALTQARSAT